MQTQGLGGEAGLLYIAEYRVVGGGGPTEFGKFDDEAGAENVLDDLGHIAVHDRIGDVDLLGAGFFRIAVVL